MMDVLCTLSRFGKQQRMLSIVVAVLACLAATVSIYAQTEAPRLSVDNDIASAGFFRLSWETDAESVELQQATGSDFRKPITVYIGPDRAAVISGKPDGAWYYRVRAVNNSRAGPWSEPVTVAVAHHSLSRALMFLTLGVIVFIAIVLVIVRGSEKTQ